MRVFISYSFVDSELYMLALLFEQLRQNGFMTESSDHHSSGQLSDINIKISNTDYFIGIITNHSDSINSVMKEWNIASSFNKPKILIIEEGVMIENPDTFNFITFNRDNPGPAIAKLLSLNTLTSHSQPQSNVFEDAIAIGAIAVGLAALISLLPGGTKKRRKYKR